MRGLEEKCNVVLARIKKQIDITADKKVGAYAKAAMTQAEGAVRQLAVNDAREGNDSIPNAFLGDSELIMIWTVAYQNALAKLAE